MRQRGGSAERVGAAWSAGYSASGSNIHTDGHTVWSWGHHEVGTTTPEGRKVRHCCHTSISTATHSGALDEWADDVVECESHGRPDLHREPEYSRHHWRRPVLLDRCRADHASGNRSGSRPTAVLKAHPDASCTFLCLFCGFWHPNFSYTHEVRESSGEHQDDQHKDGMTTHRLNPGCPDEDVLYQRMGFSDRAEFWDLTGNHKITYGDDGQNHARYMTWKILDQTKDGLLKAFPELLVPQPAERLWWVRPYAGQTWHRCLDANPVPPTSYSTYSTSAPPALCGEAGSHHRNNGGPAKTTFWGTYRVDPPLKGRRCAACADAAAVHYLAQDAALETTNA